MTAGQIERVVEMLSTALGADLVATYLYGSAAAGGLKPASDLDVFALTRRRTTAAQRFRLIDGLRPMSARDARPATWRPIELTVVAQPDIVPWRYPPRVDFQSGEWLRAKFDAGHKRPWRAPNPDLAVLIAQVRHACRTLFGPAPAAVLPEVPAQDVVRGMVDEIDALIADLDTDTANVLLTLARIWYSLATGAFAPKDVAATWALARLPARSRRPLERARAQYLGTASGSWLEQSTWRPMMHAAGSTARELVHRIERARGVATIGGR